MKNISSKEEPKQESWEEYFCKKYQVKYARFCKDTNRFSASYNGIDWFEYSKFPTVQPKQETVEERLKNELKFIHSFGRNSDFDLGFKTGGLVGAKWQEKMMYSEEEVETIAKDAYSMGKNNMLIGVFNKWLFELIKKK